MVNKQKKALVLGAVTLGSLYGGLFFNTEEVEAAREDCSRPNDALVPVWEGEANPKEDLPTYLELNSCRQSQKVIETYNWYTNPNNRYNPYPANLKKSIRFYLQQHRGYAWYAPMLPQGMKVDPVMGLPVTDAFRSPLMIKENHDAYESDEYYLMADRYYWNEIDFNIKKKGINPFTGQEINATVKDVMSGRIVEFRYMGYSKDGKIVDNPFFPDDIPERSNGRVVSFQAHNKRWITKPWGWDSPVKKEDNIQRTEFDRKSDEKLALFNIYLFPKYPWMLDEKSFSVKLKPIYNEWKRTNGSTPDTPAYFWVDALSLRSDPTQGAAVATGWHWYTNTKGQIVYNYRSFVLDTPEKPNLRMNSFKVMDPNKGNQVMGEGTLSSKTINKTLSVGYTYTLSADMSKTSGTGPYTTTKRTPLAVDLSFRTTKGGSFTTRSDNGRPSANQTRMKKGDKVTFNKGVGGNGNWNFRINPNDVTQDKVITLSARVPYAFYQRGDNIDLSDDRIDLVFNVVQENMALSKNIKMIDKNGKSVDYVVPNRPYTFKMDVSKVSGQYPVKDATVIVKVTDGGYEKTMKAVAKTSLTKPGDAVTVETTEPFYPSTSQVTISAIIDPKHHTQRIENVYKKEEDGEFIRKIESNIDVKVNELEVSPHPTFLQSTETKGKSPYKVDFDMFNENAEGQAKAIMVRIKRNNEVIHQEKVVVPPNQKERVSFITKELPVTKGSKDKFSVEVNAPDENGVREWYEYYKGKTNPYDNNVAEATVPVLAHNAPKKVYCAVPKTSYEWKQKYNVTKLNGSFQNQTAIRYLANGKTQNVSVKEFVGSSLNRNSQTVTHKETYSFTSVQFRSKHTDNKWVELMDAKTNNVIADAEKKAVVKAGEGFDLIIKTKYTNNIPQTSPAATYTATASTFVSPAYRIHNVPEQMSVHLPFKGKDGNPFSLNIEGKQEGTWNDETQTYEMPLREKFGKETRKIFIGKNVKNGVYEVRIDTASIAGTPDKPKEVGAYLCDSKRFPLTVVGSNTDDVKSHITQ